MQVVEIVGATTERQRLYLQEAGFTRTASCDHLGHHSTDFGRGIAVWTKYDASWDVNFVDIAELRRQYYTSHPAERLARVILDKEDDIREALHGIVSEAELEAILACVVFGERDH